MITTKNDFAQSYAYAKTREVVDFAQEFNFADTHPSKLLTLRNSTRVTLKMRVAKRSHRHHFEQILHLTL